MRVRIRIVALTLLLLGAPASKAVTLQIVGGETDIALTSLGLFETLGLDLTMVGSATISGNSVLIPVTGGSLDTDTGFSLIEHMGSGIGFDNGITQVVLSEFLVDTENALVSGVAAVNGAVLGVVPLFTISPTARLRLTPTAAGALSDAFKVTIDAGIKIGILKPDVITAIPVPGAVWLMLSGLFAMTRLRKKAAV